MGNFPVGVAFSPNGTTAYITNSSSNNVSAINTATHAVTTVPVGSDPTGVAFSPNGTTAYVTNYIDANVSVIEFRSAPDAPTALAAVGGAGEATLTWDAPSFDGMTPITGYTIEYRKTGAATWTPTTVGVVNTHTVTGLSDGTTYEFRVSATNAIGTGAASAVATATTFAVPGAPTNVTATPGNAQVSLTWTAPTSNGGTAVTSYIVEFRPTGGIWTTFVPGGSGSGGGGAVTSALRLASITSTSTTVTGLTNGTAYEFRVSAINAVGTGTGSSVATATTFAVPGAPTNVTTTPSKGQVSLTWTTPASNGGTPITGYTVLYRVTGTTTWTRVDVGATTSATIKNLTAGATYSFTVLATNTVGDGATSTTVTTTASNHVMAFTGFEPSTISWVLLLLLAGGATIAIGRRRRVTAHNKTQATTRAPSPCGDGALVVLMSRRLKGPSALPWWPR